MLEASRAPTATRGAVASGLPITATLVVLALALFPAMVWRGQVLYERDVLHWWFPQAEALRAAVRDGSWPLWNRFSGFGQPLLADPTYQACYPPTWLLLVLPPLPYFSLYAVGHLLLGALGVRSLSRRFCSLPAAGNAAAMVFLLSGPFVSCVNVWPHLAGAAWMPWIAEGAERALSRGRMRDAVHWGVLAALPVLAASPDMELFSALLCVALVLRRGWDAIRQRAGTVLAAAAIALLLSAVQWLPALDLTRDSGRAAMFEKQRSAWAIERVALVELMVPVFPSALGTYVDRYDPDREVVDQYLRSIYLGLPVAGLVAAGVVRRRAPRGLFVGMTCLSVLFALGLNTPAYRAMVAAFPPLAFVHFPAKAMVPAALAWALLAGMGVEELAAAGSGRTRAVAVTVLAVAVGVSGGLAWRLPVLFERWAVQHVAADRVASFVRALAPLQAHAVAAVAFGAAGVLLLWLGQRTGRDLTGALVALAVIDLLAAHSGLNPTTPLARATRPPRLLDVFAVPSPRVFVWDYVIGSNPSRRSFGSVLGSLDRYESPFAHQEYLLPPSGERWGVRGAFELDRLGLYTTDMRRMSLLIRSVEDGPGYLRLLRIGSVEFTVSLHDPREHGLPLVARVEGVWPIPIQAARVPDPLPRAYAVGRTRLAQGDAARQLLLDPGFDPRSEVVLESPAPSFDLQRAKVHITGESANREELSVDVDTAAYVVLVESFDPHWRAEVDGRPVQVRRANTVFRAVAVPAGSHRVVFAYRPWPVRWGLLISGAALLATTSVLVAGRRAAPPTA